MLGSLARWLISVAAVLVISSGCADSGDAQARALLESAIVAHGGSAALARLERGRFVSVGRFKEKLEMRRTVTWAGLDDWAMTVDFGSLGEMRLGMEGGRCWRAERHWVSECSPDDRSEQRRIARFFGARLLQGIDPARVRSSPPVTVAGEAFPAIQSGDLILVFSPETRRLVQIRSGDRVDVLSQERQIDGAWVAMRRALTIADVLDVAETWVADDVQPFAAEELAAPAWPRDGVVMAATDPARLVVSSAWDGDLGGLRGVVEDLERRTRAGGGTVSNSDGIVLTAPTADGDGWRVAVALEPGSSVHGLAIEAWPPLRSVGVFQSGKELQLPAALDRIDTWRNARGVDLPPPGAVQVLLRRGQIEAVGWPLIYFVRRTFPEA